MDRGLYLAAVGMRVNLTRQDVRANNLANVSTVGFAGDREVIASFVPRASGPARAPGRSTMTLQIPSFVATVVNADRGAFQDTESPLDVTIQGPGYLELGDGANRRYARTASLRVSLDGVLTTSDGRPVAGSRGPVQVGKGLVTIGGGGEVVVDDRVVDKLRIVDLGAAGNWVKAAEGGFVAVGAVPTIVATPDVATGVLEQSNVNSITEMVGMISLYRHFEAGQKSIRAIDETLEKAVMEVGSLR